MPPRFFIFSFFFFFELGERNFYQNSPTLIHGLIKLIQSWASDLQLLKSVNLIHFRPYRRSLSSVKSAQVVFL